MHFVKKIDNVAVPVVDVQGFLSDWKTWKNGNAFSSQGKLREFWPDWKSQGKITQNTGKLREFQTNFFLLIFSDI